MYPSIITIYFDTNFFVWLAQANDAKAERVIADLNDRGVRHVISLVHFCELLQAWQRGEDNRRLYARLQAMRNEPLLSVTDSLYCRSCDTTLTKPPPARNPSSGS
ncbi:MAG: hypothetical protein MUC50_23810 [Myxococcota bacterium]|nr:hypothetical protein [Myxococcota bacterium]